MAFVNSIRLIFFLSTTPLEAGEYGAVVSWIIPKDRTNELNALDSYSRRSEERRVGKECRP